MNEEEQLVGTLIKIESHRQVEFIPNECSRHIIDSEGLPIYAKPQPQLTIPAWVAKYQKALEWDGDRHFADDINPYREKGDENRFWNWRRIGDNNLIYRIYKACREMEADIQLVKVVE